MFVPLRLIPIMGFCLICFIANTEKELMKKPTKSYGGSEGHTEGWNKRNKNKENKQTAVTRHACCNQIKARHGVTRIGMHNI